jgi:hypothetical protein
MKLVLNLGLDLNRTVPDGALAFVRACGVAPETALEVVKSGPSYWCVMDTQGAGHADRESHAGASRSI